MFRAAPVLTGICARLPLGPRRTQLTTKWLVNRDVGEGVDYDLKELTHVCLTNNDQDSRIVSENQIGANAPGFEPGPYFAAHESGVSQFLDWYVSRLQTRMVFNHVA
jgi:phenylpropionate dioxygenase-like ring-hydroxylating dioxygenase large terminal subunit